MITNDDDRDGIPPQIGHKKESNNINLPPIFVSKNRGSCDGWSISDNDELDKLNIITGRKPMQSNISANFDSTKVGIFGKPIVKKESDSTTMDAINKLQSYHVYSTNTREIKPSPLISRQIKIDNFMRYKKINS